MKSTRIITLLLTLILFASCNEKPIGSKGDEVQAAWDEFKQASLSSNGEIAANRVTTKTHDYYAEIGDDALTAERHEIQNMSVARQVTVLGIRLRVPSSELKTMSGRDLFVHAVEQGWIGKDGASDEGITDIQINGDHARANATKAGQKTDQLLHFIREDKIWRFDMMPLMKFVNGIFADMQKESGLEEEEFVRRLIENVTSKRLTESDWNP